MKYEMNKQIDATDLNFRISSETMNHDYRITFDARKMKYNMEIESEYIR